jgi:DNA-binding MarR family transcriptional regulator
MFNRKDIVELFSIFPYFPHAIIKSFKTDVGIKLNHSERKTLMTIAEKKNRSMAFYSRMAGLEKGSFTTTIDNLTSKGLIERTTYSNDQRKIILVLTGKGKEVSSEIKKQFKAHLNKLISRLTKSEQEELFNAMVTLRKVAKKIEQ